MTAQGFEKLPAAGQNFMRVGLMADVEQQPVLRHLEHPVQRKNQLHRAEARPEVAAVDADRLDHQLADFGGELLKLRDGQPREVCR